MRNSIVVTMVMTVLVSGCTRNMSDPDLQTQLMGRGKSFMETCPKMRLYASGGNRELMEQFDEAYRILLASKSTSQLASEFGKFRFGEVKAGPDGEEAPYFGEFFKNGAGKKDLTVLFARTAKWIDGPGLMYHVELIDGKQAIVIAPSVWTSRRLFATVLAHELYHVANPIFDDRIDEELDAWRFELQVLEELIGCELAKLVPAGRNWREAVSKIRISHFRNVADAIGEKIGRDEALQIFTTVAMSAGLRANHGDPIMDRELYQFMEGLSGYTESF